MMHVHKTRVITLVCLSTTYIFKIQNFHAPDIALIIR